MDISIPTAQELRETEEKVEQACKKGEDVDNVHKGFYFIIPKKLRLMFLERMKHYGWIEGNDFTSREELIGMLEPNTNYVHLIARYEFLITNDGRYCVKKDKLSGDWAKHELSLF